MAVPTAPAAVLISASTVAISADMEPEESTTQITSMGRSVVSVPTW